MSSSALRFAPRFALQSATFITALAGLAGLAAPAQAQSLSELVEAARSYDAAFLGAKSQAEAARFKADQSGALRLPSVGLGAGITRSMTDYPYLPGSSSGNNSTTKQVALSAQQTLYNRANGLTIEQSERSVNVAQAQAQAAEQDLAVRVAQAYFDVLASQDALTTVQASKKAIAEQLASAKRNFEVGTATITDTREAQARFDLSTAQELAAENDLRVKRLALDQLVGRSAVAPKALAQPVALPDLSPAVVDEWVIAAERNSLSIRQAQLGLEVAKLETAKAEAGHLPTATLSASYARLHQGLDYRAGLHYGGSGSNASIGVAVNVPLFAGYAIENRVKETVALEEKSRQDLDNARRSVSQATRAAFFGVQSGLAQVKALEAAESSSKLALDAIALGYKVGVRVNLDVLNAQTQLFQTQRDLAKARYDVIVAGLKLRQVSGQLAPADVDSVNQLLAR
jgi:outer membrane protein